MSLSKQSDVYPNEEIPIEHPKASDLRNFKSYMLKLERKYHDIGAVLLHMPPSHQPTIKNISPNTVLPKIDPLSCKPVTVNGETIYEIDYHKDRTFTSKFRTYKQKSESKNVPLDNNFVKFEDKAWDWVASRQETEYSIANNFKLYNKECPQPNMGHLTRAESIIYDNDDLGRIAGVTTPYVYLGSYLTYFGFHVEDALLVSLNYLHSGHPKFWYKIPPQYRNAVEELA